VTSHRKLNGHADRVISVAFLPNGTKIASSSDDRPVRTWDAAKGRQLWELKSHIDPVNSVVFSPNGTEILSCSNYRAARTWDAATGKQLREVNSYPDLYGVALSPDGTKIVSCRNNVSWICVSDTATGAPLRTHHGGTHSATSVVFSPNGTMIASGSDDCSVRI
jgi:WD40 repeat protein